MDDQLDTTAATQSPPSSSGLVQGELLAGRYRLVRFVAAGGMGEVWEAEDQALGERVALKTVRADAVDPQALERFRAEVRLARRVAHRNVCRVFEFGEHLAERGNRVPFFTMELLGGQSLQDLVHARGRLSLEEALPLVAQLAAALDAAHAEGVIHRDFKSPNVFLEPPDGGQRRAVVTDFGLARAVSGDVRLTQTGPHLFGTPGYMAPEQVEGRDCGAAADLYALGVVTFELLTGRLPFSGDSALAVAVARLKQPPLAARSLVPELPAHVDAALARAMARAESARFPSAAEFVQALRAPVGVAPGLRGPQRRRSAVAVGLGLAIASAAAGMAAAAGGPGTDAETARELAAARGFGTESLEAWRAWLRAEALFRTAWYDTALVQVDLEQAIASDPGWAHPRAALVLLQGVWGDGPGRTLKLAQEVVGQSKRDSRGVAVLDALALLRASKPLEVGALLESHLVAAPADPLVGSALVMAQILGGRTDEARASLALLHEHRPDLQFGADLAGLLLQQGKFEEVQQLSAAWLARVPSAEQALLLGIAMALERDDAAAVTRLTQELLQRHGDAPHRWLAASDAMLGVGDLVQARHYADRLVGQGGPWKARGLYRSGLIALFEGRLASAAVVLASAEAAAEGVGSQSEVTDILEALRKVQQFQGDDAGWRATTAKVLRIYGERGSEVQAAQVRFSLAQAEARCPDLEPLLQGIRDAAHREDARRALLRHSAAAGCGGCADVLRAGEASFEGQTLSLADFGRCAASEGQLVLAREVLARAGVARSTALSTIAGNPIAATFARYELAQVLERQGERTEAAAAYRRFLGSWAHAEATIPKVAQAKAALLRLQ